MNVLLDSSVIISYLAGERTAVEAVDSSEEVKTSSICEFEVLLGEDFGELRGLPHKRGIRRFFDSIDVISFEKGDGEVASRIQATLMLKGNPINVADVLIAAQAVRRNLAILTKDRDFSIIQKFTELDLKLIG